MAQAAIEALDAEMSVIDLALDRTAQHSGQVLVIEGSPGIGTSTLLSSTAYRAGEHGWTVRFARTPTTIRELADSAAMAALGYGADLEEELDQRSDPTAPCALLVDDAHLADELSLQLLCGVARRIPSQPVLLAVALWPHVLDDPQRDSIEELAALAHASRLSLSPLAADSLRVDRAAVIGADARRRTAEPTDEPGERGDSGARVPWAAPPVDSQVIDRLVELSTTAAGLEPGADRAAALLELGVAQAAAGSPRTASRAFSVASETAPADDPLSAEAAAASAFADLIVPESRERAVARIERMSAGGEPHRGGVLLARSWRLLCEGAPRDLVIRQIRHALQSSDDARAEVDGYFDTVAAVALACADDFAAAARVLDRAAATADAAGAVLAARNLGLARSFKLLYAGQVQQAAERSGALLHSDAGGSRLEREFATTVLADALHERGADAEAEAEAEALVAATLQSGPSCELTHMFLLETETRLRGASRDPAKALGAARELERLAELLGIDNPSVVPWHATAALCHAHSGNARRARQLIEDAVHVAERFGAPRALAMMLRVKARIVGPPQELEDLEHARSVIQDSDAALERARVNVEHGTALHRAGDARRARNSLRLGLELADQQGARRLTQTALTALLAAGGRPRRMRISGPEALTPAERRVVALAAGGASNREIAEQLVVTRKTVEWHLSKAFAKLGVRSREQLAEVTGGGERGG